MIELNASDIEVVELRHEMGRASRCRFYRLADLADADPIPTRSEVQYTVITPGFPTTVVTWFYGRTLPSRRVTRAGQEMVEYIAADPIEFLAHNPCDEISEWYNKNDIEVSPVDYPNGQTVRQIIEAELASLVGDIITSLDFTNGGDAANVIPSNFQTAGKTFLGLLDALVNESPGLTYWFDPAPGGFGQGVLRFYDLSVVPSATLTYRLPRRDGVANGADIEVCEIAEDISSAYDTLKVQGWGAMVERREQATPGWSIDPDAFDYYLRYNDGAIEAFVPSGAGGAWVPEASLNPRPWFPESGAPGYKQVGRRFSVTHDIVDYRIEARAGSPVQYTRFTQSMWPYAIQYVWNVGSLGFFEGGSVTAGRLYGNVKLMPFSGGIVSDSGEVVPNEYLYPNFPIINDTDPLFVQPAPSAYDKNYFVLREPLIRRTVYLFQESRDPDWENIVDSQCFRYWLTSEPLSFQYTSKTPLEISRNTPGLNYNKSLVLYDQRFVHYTNAAGVVIRDDTAILNTYADAVFPLISRPRIYGEIAVNADVNETSLSELMGRGIKIVNWKSDGAEYVVPARVQSVDLAHALYQKRVVLSFDREITFLPLSHFVNAREFQEANEHDGATGLVGKRGDKDPKRPPPPVKRPADEGIKFDFGPTERTGTNETNLFAAVVAGRILSRTTDTGSSVDVMYTAETIDGEYRVGAGSPPADVAPAYRPFSDHTQIAAAEVGSECLIGLVLGEDGLYHATLLFVREKVRFVESHMFRVYVTIDGGTAGTLSSTCSFTYTVTTNEGSPVEVLGMGMTPERRRLVNTPYSTTPSGTKGFGYFDSDGVFVLYDANETAMTGPDCP
jgi:hypothetical protein